MRYSYFVIIPLILCLFSCGSVSRQPAKGRAEYRVWSYNPLKKEMEPDSVFANRTFLFKDSFLLVFMPTAKFVTIFDEKGETTSVSYPVESYWFIDLRRQRFYEFKTFFDTASVSRATGVDVMGRGPDNWITFSKDTFMYTGSREILPDTTMGGISFSRIKGYRQEATPIGDTVIKSVVAFYACKLKHIPLQIDNMLTRQLGCPVLRKEYQYRSNMLWTELVYLGDKLSANEERVVDAWIQKVSKK